MSDPTRAAAGERGSDADGVGSAGAAAGTGAVRSDAAADADPAVVVRDLAKTYGDDVRALDGVSFTVDRGEVVGLLGPNGAGKTTCIKSVLGLVLPSSGSVELAGVDAHADTRRAHRRVGAMLEGARNVYWRLTVRENLAFFAGLAGRSPAALRERHDALLDRFGLAEWADTPVRNLSRGMKQKVALACTLSRDVDVAFLDEPTLGLDVESSRDLRSELRTLAREEGLTVVLSSHDMDVIEDLCDRVVILSAGRVVADDSVETLLDVFRTQTYRVVVDGAPDGLRDRLAAEYDLTEWTTDGGRTRFEVTLASGNRVADLTRTLVDAGCAIRSVDTAEPDLEEAFVRLTRGDDP
ncbi:ABC transporter ATP-binding protein [Candidatus Halobonum tyrrellensis]|uniref:ABC transporter ATP-binding protein n=1 Tax=Candidatus Halobonum tyrrellensis TaxID=1431545 RepID=UPI0012679499|nr:ABC transporter ATP-binding protein [Candidatus Halobonum tyrrellensis]